MTRYEVYGGGKKQLYPCQKCYCDKLIMTVFIEDDFYHTWNVKCRSCGNQKGITLQTATPDPDPFYMIQLWNRKEG